MLMVRSASKPIYEDYICINITHLIAEVNAVHWHSETAKSSDLWPVKQQQRFGCQIFPALLKGLLLSNVGPRSYMYKGLFKIGSYVKNVYMSL